MKFITMILSAATAAGCASGGAASTSAEPAATQPLAGIVGQNIVIAPVQAFRLPAEVGWPAVPARATLSRVDSVIADSLRARVGNQGWIYAGDVIAAAASNPTYATDPRSLAVNPFRARLPKLGDRLPEPLASQVRTMIAFHDARLVLLPIDLTVDPVSGGIGRPVVRLVLLDPRSSVVRWTGQVTGPESAAFTSDLSATIAARLADLFVPR